jgi:hypothetical protein
MIPGSIAFVLFLFVVDHLMLFVMSKMVGFPNLFSFLTKTVGD